MNLSTTTKITPWRSGLAAALAATLLAGCASLGGGTPEQIVAQRAAGYWKARAAGDYVKAYSFSTPAYRKVNSAEKFRTQFGAGAAIHGGEAVKVDCEAEKCAARIKISATPALLGLNLGTIATYLDEIWLLEDGQWWRHQDL